MAIEHLKEAEEISRPTVAMLPGKIAVSDGVVLNRITPAHKDDLFGIIGRNPDIRQHVAWAAKVDEPADVIPRLTEYSDEQLSGRYAIDTDGVMVGYGGIHPGQREYEYGIGYFLDSAARGRGIVAGVVIALMEQAQTRLGARHFYLQIKPDNTGSVAVAENLNFVPAETVMGVDFPVEQRRWRLSI